MEIKEYYQRMYLQEGASIKEVKEAHRKLVKKFHPDKNFESNEFEKEFKLIQEAYEKLIEYLESKEANKNFTDQTSIKKSKAKYAESSDETGLVKSKSQYASAVKIESTDILNEIIMGGLIIIFFICLLVALFNQF